MPDNDYDIDAFLAHRRYEPARPGLEGRIIATARSLPQKRGFSVAQWLRELVSETLPQPAYALALVLVMGLGIGFADQPPAEEEPAPIYGGEVL